jgi:hypothetical protein
MQNPPVNSLSLEMCVLVEFTGSIVHATFQSLKHDLIVPNGVSLLIFLLL